ncbi:hypothetical protein [Streptomyces lavendulocolor]|jgi:hypothetical protein|uniref:hypothetical protein n=1 Tax=Streptomyces lavendulocolor TaxID=67316 RepID=UPI0033D9DCC9
MNVGEWAAVIGAAGSVLGGGGWWISRATVRAAQATAAANEAAARAAAAPAQQAANLAVLEATVKRVDEENGQLRGRVFRLESVVRAFQATFDDFYRWAREPVGSPPDPHPLVEEFNRTGV